MTAQEQGLAQIVTLTRQLVPPQLDFLVLVFMPDGKLHLTSVMYPSVHGKTTQEQYERAKEAAHAFLTEPPREDFTAAAKQRN